MRKATDGTGSSHQSVYIPHHPVIRESSLTTRLRVVFNASSLTSNAKSLNDHLLSGPKLQTDIAAVILRWRQYRYVYAADIEKMYRQILVDPRDVDYQRILWKGGEEAQAQPYQLLTVTYGTTSAPYLALRVLRQLVSDEGHEFPLAVSVLQENIYVDDVLFGADDIPFLRQLRDQVCGLLLRGKFELRKWSSNSDKLLTDIEIGNHGLACDKTLQSDEQLKILGISWNPASDAFRFRVSFPPSLPRTKRAILSMIAKIFDPLGWVTPVVITAKIFLQKLWQLKLDWDEPIPDHALVKWASIQSSLADLNGLHLPRWTGRGADSLECELHGFADASSTAYAAAVYMRITSLSGEITSVLLIGKSKVAPVKTLSIPRLELAAAVLLAKLMEFVRINLHLTTTTPQCWTDSTVVLAWITQHPSKWKTFVSNRVSDIQTRIPSALWRHVPTHDNPIDCASRGVLGQQLSSNSLWWQGPSWLRLPPSEWPPQDNSIETSVEHNPRFVTHVNRQFETWDLANRYSSWPKLIRVTAYLRRFVVKLRQKASQNAEIDASPRALSLDEWQWAKTFWLAQIQTACFPREKEALDRQKSLSAKSFLLSLNPYLDDEKLIRVGGRLAHSSIPRTRKHPVILASYPLVLLIVQHAHMKSLHAGIQLTLATLRREYWILRSRSVVKAVIHKCVKCVRERAATPTQLMSALPPIRITPSRRAFVHCGVDYAGPISVRSISGRGVASRKAYIAVFVCMTTRAIHLEVVDGYSTSAFLGAYSRFCARRGLPESIYSDNGTTFVGADREMTAAYRASLRDPNFLNLTKADNVSWHFMPPSAPHFGGLWEAGVRSVKHHLRRVVGSHTLTFEEMTTLLCNVEACLNSRPLAPLTEDAENYDPLTPGHFLIGSAITAHPEPSILDVRENRLTRWQIVRQLTERIWKLWQSDYVNTLQQRVKWRKIMNNPIKVGQLVLLRNSLLPPCKWELGRVIQCHPGADGLVRVVTVKTASSIYKRPICKVCLLPIDVEAGSDH